ncbi:hypothetical protein GCM10029978_085070 [Actinoallomurus acanthiterrae]
MGQPGRAELPGDPAGGLPYGAGDGLAGGPFGHGDDHADRADDRPVAVEDRCRQPALADDGLLLFRGEGVGAYAVEPRAELGRVRHRVTGHAAQWAARQERPGLIGRVGEDRLAERAGVRGDDDADLRHLP